MLAIKTRSLVRDYSYIGAEWTSQEPMFNKMLSERGFFDDFYPSRTDVVITVQDDGTLEGGLCWIPSFRKDSFGRDVRYGIFAKGQLGDADTTTFMQLAARVVQAKNDSSQKEAIGKELDEYFTSDKVASLLGASFDPEAEWVKKLREIAEKCPLATDEPADKNDCKVDHITDAELKIFCNWLNWLAKATTVWQPVVLILSLDIDLTGTYGPKVKQQDLETFFGEKFGGTSNPCGYILVSYYKNCTEGIPYTLKKKKQIVPNLRSQNPLPLEGALAAAVAIAILLAVIVLINQKPREEPPQQTNPPMIQEEF